MPLFERPPLETLASAKDRWTPLHLEHGRLEVDDSTKLLKQRVEEERLLQRMPKDLAALFQTAEAAPLQAGARHSRHPQTLVRRTQTQRLRRHCQSAHARQGAGIRETQCRRHEPAHPHQRTELPRLQNRMLGRTRPPRHRIQRPLAHDREEAFGLLSSRWSI